MAYATYSDVELRLNRTFSIGEQQLCSALLDDAAVIIDAYNKNADSDTKLVVSCRMVTRAIGNSNEFAPIGANQGSMSALGYTQSWTFSNGSAGELYLSKLDKKLLGLNDRIGAHSPIEDM